MFCFYFVKFYVELIIKKLLILLTLFLSLGYSGLVFGISDSLMSPGIIEKETILIHIEDPPIFLSCELDGDTLLCVGEDRSAFEFEPEDLELISVLKAPPAASISLQEASFACYLQSDWCM